ncbi:kell blood group glycoprotein [Pholidichthys leucotaenia]
MRETPELELQPLSEPKPEMRLHHRSLLPPPSQNPYQFQPRLQQQLSRSTTEHPVWKKRQKLLLLFLGFCSCAAIPGLIYFIYHNHQTVTPCVSSACQWASARLSTTTDPFTQPCEYFRFKCNSDRHLRENSGRQTGQDIHDHTDNYVETSVKSERRGTNEGKEEGRLMQDTVLNRKDVLLQYFKEILEINDRLDSLAVQKTKGFYHSCLNTTSIESAGTEPFLKLIQKLGGWAVSGQWNKTDFNSTLSLLMRDYATFPFFKVYVGKDPSDLSHGTSKRYIEIDQPDFLIPIEWDNSTHKSKAKAEDLRPFLALCQKYLALLGATNESSMIHVGTFLSLSSELAVASSPQQYRLLKGQLNQRITIKELQRRAPAIDWLGCLQSTFHPLLLSEDNHVLLHNLPYIVQMSRIIIKWLYIHELRNSGPLHTFMFFNLMHTLMPAMDSRFSETAKNFAVALGSTNEEIPRWKQCVLEMEKGFDSVLMHLLSKMVSRREAEKIIQNVFYSFKSKLLEISRTDHKSLEFVIQKVFSINPKLRTTVEISTEAELELLFSKVTVNTYSFFSNYLQLLSLMQKRRSKLLTAQSDADNMLSVTPSLLGNELLFPMGVFVPPLFHPTYPRAMSYGASGFLIAKDIFHLLLPDIHSQSKTVQAVGECVWAHYLSVTEKAGAAEGFSLSKVQQQEVWVQYSALQVAMKAYHKSLNEQPADTSLAGLSHTRLFLTSFAQVYCDVDPYNEFMPLESTFLIAVICAESDLCPTTLQCSIKAHQNSSQIC